MPKTAKEAILEGILECRMAKEIINNANFIEASW